MKRKVFLNLCIISVSAAILSCCLIFAALYISFTTDMQKQVRKDAHSLSGAINRSPSEAMDILSRQETLSHRITLIEVGGKVMFDNVAGSLENHADRPEIGDAIAKGSGQSTRVSDTMQTQTYYYAVRLKNDLVLRVSSATDSVFSSILSCVPFLIVIIIFISLLSLVAAKRLTKRLVAPINCIDVENPTENETYEELNPLLLRLDKQNSDLDRQIKATQAMRDDLADIMENMVEGLVVLNENGTVISINRAALKIFGQPKQDCLNQPLLALNRDEAFLKLSQAARNGVHAEVELTQNGHVYTVSLSCSANGGNILLIVDVTSKKASEKMRREFSANVSHELKTPLQAISGYAELLKNNLVKDEDKASFVERIYDESQRMIVLVQDIINLSRLDEGGSTLPRENVDLLDLVNEVVGELSSKAESKQIALVAKGSSVVLSGVKRLLKDSIFNLVDNALIYNKQGGSATISVKRAGSNAILSLSDTGIGIPASDIQRVFERFYRVDKSHSRTKDGSGTGLGLSIVKHAAALHNAQITLDSTENIGTTIQITFPISE